MKRLLSFFTFIFMVSCVHSVMQAGWRSRQHQAREKCKEKVAALEQNTQLSMRDRMAALLAANQKRQSLYKKTNRRMPNIEDEIERLSAGIANFDWVKKERAVIAATAIVECRQLHDFVKDPSPALLEGAIIHRPLACKAAPLLEEGPEPKRVAVEQTMSFGSAMRMANARHAKVMTELQRRFQERSRIPVEAAAALAVASVSSSSSSTALAGSADSTVPALVALTVPSPDGSGIKITEDDDYIFIDDRADR